MICNINRNELIELLLKQLKTFCSNSDRRVQTIENNIDEALGKIKTNFQCINNKYYDDDGEIRFSTNHADQYTLFLYYLCNSIYKKARETKNRLEHECAEQIFYLNRIMNGVNWFYAIDLPQHFYAEHPVGSVLGRAQYGDYLCIYQGVTIGGTFDKKGNILYPSIGEKVTCFANSSILGNCQIGNNVVIGANTLIINKTIPDNSLVLGSGNNIVIKPNDIEMSLWKNVK